MCLRLSARGELLVPSKTFSATCLLVPLSRWKCVCASAPEVCFLRRDEFFRKLFSDAVGSLNSDALLGAGHRKRSFSANWTAAPRSSSPPLTRRQRSPHLSLVAST